MRNINLFFRVSVREVWCGVLLFGIQQAGKWEQKERCGNNFLCNGNKLTMKWVCKWTNSVLSGSSVCAKVGASSAIFSSFYGAFWNVCNFLWFYFFDQVKLKKSFQNIYIYHWSKQEPVSFFWNWDFHLVQMDFFFKKWKLEALKKYLSERSDAKNSTVLLTSV